MNTTRLSPSLLVLPLLVLASPVSAGSDPACAVEWRPLQKGVAYASVPVTCGGKLRAPNKVAATKDQLLHMVRVDPRRARLQFLMASANKDAKNLTASGWAHKHKLAVAINLGMYREDHSTHCGRLHAAGHVNSKAWARTYKSLLLLDGKGAHMLDLDAPGAMKRARSAPATAQNLRIVKRGSKGKGVGTWSRKSKRRWSEAALAQDNKGRLLFLFARAPLTMWEFSRLLLRLPLGLEHAAHLEGGPEASLSVHAGGVDLDLCGSFESGFMPNDSNRSQWPLPNVLGVARE